MLEMLSILDKPSMLHAAVVHLPIALVVVGIPMLVLSAIFHRSVALRLLTLLVYLSAAVSGWVAEETGEGANRHVPLEIPAAVSALRDEHMEMGERVPIAAAVVAVLVLLSFVPFKEARAGFHLLALVAAVISAGLTAYTAHLGGELVYDHGVGTPHMAIYAPKPPAPPAAETAPTDAAPMPAPAPAPEPPAEPLVPVRPIDLEAAKQVSYVRDIVPIMEEYCIDCHENPDADGNFDVTSVANLLKAGDKAGPGVIPGDPDQSSIVRYIRGELQPRMPKKKKPLSEETLHTIRQWIAAGAIDDSVAAAPAAAVAVPAPEPAPAPEPMPVPESVPAPEPAPAPAPAPETAPEPAPIPEPTPAPEPETVPAPEITPASEPVPEPSPAPESAPAASSAPAPAP